MELYPEEYYSDNSEFDEYLDSLDEAERQQYDMSSLKQITRRDSVLKGRLGEIHVSNQGYSLEIIAYRAHDDIDVLVDGTHIIIGDYYKSCLQGCIRKPHTLLHYKHHKKMQNREVDVSAYRYITG